MEDELNEGKKMGNWDYQTKTQNFMKSVQELNAQLRKVRINEKQERLKKILKTSS